MRTSDGFDVPWEKSRASITSLSKAELLALKEGDAASKCVAYAKLTEGQFLGLFGSKSQATNRADTRDAVRRRMGQRIVQLDVYQYCRGLGELRLNRILSKAAALQWPRERVIKELLQWT